MMLANTRPRQPDKYFPAMPDTTQLISYHGGHSGEFCAHAQDQLEEVIRRYIELGFQTVGISEHMPPEEDRFVYDDEHLANLDIDKMQNRFACYMSTCRQLQSKYASQIRIFVGFETETYHGYKSWVRHLIRKFEPDYIVGSIHHVDDPAIDSSPKHYRRAVDAANGLDQLYCRYFDQQLEMIELLKPQVVGHLDLIRKFDHDYGARLVRSEIWSRITRNLQRIKELGLILDLNMRPMVQGGTEPYPSRPILEHARTLDIPVVPGDDSHGVATVGKNIDHGIQILKDLRFCTEWPELDCKAPNTK